MKIKSKSKHKSINKTVIIKVIIAALIPILTFIFLDLFDYTLNIFALVLCFTGILFTIPFYITLAKIKKSPLEPIGKYVLFDFIEVTSVSILTSLVCDLVNVVRYGMKDFSGITTLLLGLIFIIINAVFAVIYKITMQKKRKQNK
ncbi:MAG: hypothetical protein A2Y17_02600 [Clostridiales bacterium GWF2_38_85]|nr:MAG: hypothetical protein A2Y17_02600 [Clostridiales bacterium GWF2_38_85]